MKKRLLGLLSAAVLTVMSALPVSALSMRTSEDDTRTGKTPDGEYQWLVWNEGDAGKISFDGDKINGGAFSCKWEDVRLCGFSKGYDLESVKSYKEMGLLDCTYYMEYTAADNSQFGMHGWVQNREANSGNAESAVEIFIVDGFTDWRPPGTHPESLGTVVDSGFTYDIYRVSAYSSFDAPQKYTQYFSVITEESNPVQTGRSTVISHKIDLNKHFEAWENAGMDMSGRMYELSFYVIGGGSGEANVRRNEISIMPDKDDLRRGTSPDGSYDYEIRNVNKSGEVAFDGDQVSGGGFSAKWDQVHDCMITKGHHFDVPDFTYKDLGALSCDYAMDYQAEGISYYGIYGTMNGLMSDGVTRRKNEYYIIDGFNQWRPNQDAEPAAQVIDNGCTYDLYCICQTWSEFSEPTEYVYQYFSVITPEDNPVKEGETVSLERKIDISKHFRAWEDAGFDMSGGIRDVSFFIFGWDSSGEAKVTKNEIAAEAGQTPESSDYQRRGKTPDGTYDYEVFSERNIGAVSFDGAQRNGGTFSCEWKDVEWSSFSKGHNIMQENDASYKLLGKMDCDYEMTCSADGISKFGMHGWIRNIGNDRTIYPLIEYYIVDGYSEWRPCGNEKSLGTVTDNGCTYDIYYVNHIHPAEGPATFLIQYFSVITEKDNPVSADGTVSVRHSIDITKHFAAWEQAGMNMTGNVLNAELFVEGYECSGEAEVTVNDLSIEHMPSAAMMGDANGDGVFSIADAVILQKWLTALPDAQLKNWQACDWNQDGTLNALDLSMMKGALIAS